MQATEIFNTADLARGMPRTCALQLISGNTIAIIGNSYQAQSTTTYLDPHFVAPRVKGILDQFFDYRGRPLDDLTRSDTFRNVLWQGENRDAFMYNCHQLSPRGILFFCNMYNRFSASRGGMAHRS